MLATGSPSTLPAFSPSPLGAMRAAERPVSPGGGYAFSSALRDAANGRPQRAEEPFRAADAPSNAQDTPDEAQSDAASGAPQPDDAGAPPRDSSAAVVDDHTGASPAVDETPDDGSTEADAPPRENAEAADAGSTGPVDKEKAKTRDNEAPAQPVDGDDVIRAQAPPVDAAGSFAAQPRAEAATASSTESDSADAKGRESTAAGTRAGQPNLTVAARSDKNSGPIDGEPNPKRAAAPSTERSADDGPPVDDAQARGRDGAATSSREGDARAAATDADPREPSGAAPRSPVSDAPGLMDPSAARAAERDGRAAESKRRAAERPAEPESSKEAQPAVRLDARQSAASSPQSPLRAGEAAGADERDAGDTRTLRSARAPDEASAASEKPAPTAPHPTPAPASGAAPAHQQPNLAVRLAPAPHAPQSYAPEQAHEQQTVSIMSRGLQAALSQRSGSLMLRLNPPSLGSLRIQVSVEQGVVSAAIEASTQAGQDILARNMDALRTALESRGMEVHRLEARLAPAPPQGQTSTHQQGADADRSADHDDHQRDPNSDSNGQREHAQERDSRGRSSFSPQALAGDEGLARGYVATRFGDHLRLTLSAVA